MARHAWISRVIGWHRSVYDGKDSGIPKGEKFTARTQYSCPRCGTALPEGHAPTPWWAAGNDGDLINCKGTK